MSNSAVAGRECRTGSREIISHWGPNTPAITWTTIRKTFRVCWLYDYAPCSEPLGGGPVAGRVHRKGEKVRRWVKPNMRCHFHCSARGIHRHQQGNYLEADEHIRLLQHLEAGKHADFCNLKAGQGAYRSLLADPWHCVTAFPAYTRCIRPLPLPKESVLPAA